MRWRIALPVGLIVLLGAGFCASVRADQISDGVAEAARTGKYVLIDFWADWCKWCLKMDDTMAQADVSQVMKAKFVYVKLDADNSPAESRAFGVKGIPFMVILDGTGKVVAKQEGYLEADAFLEWMNTNAPAGGATADGGASNGPVDIAYLAAYLDRMKLKYQINEVKGEAHVEMPAARGSYQVYVVAQPKPKLAFVIVRGYMTVKSDCPYCDKVLRRLMELNAKLNVGKFDWTSEDGQVRVLYAFSTQNGVGYEAFKAVFETITNTADERLPELQKLAAAN